MTPTPSIPVTVREILSHPAAPGQRHAQIVRIASSLIGVGFSAEDAYAIIRPSYDAGIPDPEIRDIIRWAGKKLWFSAQSIPGNSGESRFAYLINRRNAPPPSHFPPPLAPEAAINRFLRGFTCEEADLWEASPIRLTSPFDTDAESLLNWLYAHGENINIVCQYAINAGKAHPAGCGTTAPREKWLSDWRENGPPISESGVWIRPNPTDGRGIADANIVAFRFALVEFDSISISLQIPFLARLPLPIAAIITSGGKSLHAWISIRAETAGEYRGAVSQLFELLKPFGIDLANRNPSRLSRLPGVTRKIGNTADNRQRLVYLNPTPESAKIIP